MNRFLDVRALSDADIAHLSRELQIDIAVDLTGFTQNERSGIFARRAAPVQISYLGFPGTMGADFIDYLIADRTLVPTSSQPHYSEKIIYMPDCFQANDADCPVAASARTRVDEDLPADGFVYCCFNNNYKITPEIFDRWMRILGQVENSVLWLLEDHPCTGDNLHKEASLRGIAPQRLRFARRLPRAEHIARQKLADLFLDTHPFNAGATASLALRAGLPLLTYRGETFASRMAASLLHAIGLPELVTSTQQEYEDLAVALARDPSRYAELRHRLQRNLQTTPLFNTQKFTRQLESAYSAIYQRSQAGLAPEHLTLQ
jgi:predicted O-linked N-acetylglucosamine transferase (SPINDLY family)